MAEVVPRVVIVGVGAIGSHAMLFARNWSERIIVVDHDRIEAKNVLAQMHTRGAVTRNKALSMQAMLRGFFGTSIEAVPHKLTVDNVAVLLGGAKLVIDCTDNAEARSLMQHYCGGNGIALLHAAQSNDGRFARIGWAPAFGIDAEDAGVPTCEDGMNLDFHGLVGAHVAAIARAYIDESHKRSALLTRFVYQAM